MEITSGTLGEDQERCLEVDNTVTKDHISELPADIISCILSLLTMKDAVKARVLSPRWRYLCTAPSNLHFDLLSIFGITYDRRYRNKISNTLWEGSESACHIDRWVSFAIRKQTKELCLNFSLVPQSCELYSFPCHLLPQGKACQLKHLNLKSCVLKPSPEFANCLNSLIKLRLNNVPLDQSDFSDILSGCVNLEFLKLEKCSLPATFFIRHLRLRELFLKRCGRAKKIDISCINLTTLDFFGKLHKLRFIDVPLLKDVFVYPSFKDSIFNGPADDLPQIRNLKQVLYVARLQSMRVHDDNVTWEFSEQLYPQLKEVELSGFCDRCCNLMGLATYLLKNAVGLERMIIISNKTKMYCGAGKWKYSTVDMMTKAEKDRVHAVLSKEKVRENVELIIV
ncbi:hypothetical protein IFM89_027370 [Coptis chinensis]|uniref:F-box domain-containing protein n=1 Tax=Coptis chinensis TaxID=261450 RepID=A0A835IFE5_9MAGN|nr:hypothetical protein IFM89_027370 [Coptis chinensis]